MNAMIYIISYKLYVNFYLILNRIPLYGRTLFERFHRGDAVCICRIGSPSRRVEPRCPWALPCRLRDASRRPRARELLRQSKRKSFINQLEGAQPLYATDHYCVGDVHRALNKDIPYTTRIMIYLTGSNSCWYVVLLVIKMVSAAKASGISRKKCRFGGSNTCNHIKQHRWR